MAIEWIHVSIWHDKDRGEVAVGRLRENRAEHPVPVHVSLSDCFLVLFIRQSFAQSPAQNYQSFDNLIQLFFNYHLYLMYGSANGVLLNVVSYSFKKGRQLR